MMRGGPFIKAGCAIVLCLVISVLAACSASMPSPAAPNIAPSPSAAGASGITEAAPTAVERTVSQPTATIRPSETPTAQPSVQPSNTAAAGPTPASAITPQIQVQPATLGKYVVLSWNDLGMHCLNPTYDQAVILPPYNTIWAQVIERGPRPRIVTEGVTVAYRMINNTHSADKGKFGQFWANVSKLFGVSLEKDTGLNLEDPNIHNGLSGVMLVKGDHFQVNGIPVVPIDDSGLWNPYQVAEITVKDSSGAIVAQTRNTVPTSDEINCAKCHGPDPFLDVLQKHDKSNKTNLVSQQPVLCASCHGSPALGQSSPGTAGYLSQRIHGFHATVKNAPLCMDCHPGAVSQCSRSIAHTNATGNCTACHGDLQQVSTSISAQGRTPWVMEPKCATCHSGVAEVDTASTLYRNAQGHGGVYCAACHSSPHTIIPSRQGTDNYQALEYQPPQGQGRIATIGSCAACHRGSHGASEGGGLGDFAETHGGPNPETANACHICHTSITTDTASWPHQFQWKAR